MSIPPHEALDSPREMEPAYINLAPEDKGRQVSILGPPQSHVIGSRSPFCLETFLQNAFGRLHHAIVMAMAPINPGLIAPRSRVRSPPSVDVKYGIGAATIYSRSSVLLFRKNVRTIA